MDTRHHTEEPTSASGGDTALAIHGLGVRYAGTSGEPDAVRDFDLTVAAGQIVGIAGESGSGKSTVALAAMGLLPHSAEVRGSIRCSSTEIVGAAQRTLRSARGELVSIVFQENITALNPVMRVGPQLVRALRAHRDIGRKPAYERAARALRDVRLTDPGQVMRSYPDELSGGMCQRVLIAMALACGARVLIADEPTTALDVSVQREVLTLLRDIVANQRIGLVVISHDLGVLNELCDRLIVMYRGEIVETGPTTSVLAAPEHPYTQSLLDCLPRLGAAGSELPEITSLRSAGPDDECRFRSRCPLAIDECTRHPPLAARGAPDRSVRCWNPTSGRADVRTHDLVHKEGTDG